LRGFYHKLKNSQPMFRLLELLETKPGVIDVSGLAGSLGSFLTASALDGTGSSLLFVASGPSQAEAALDDLVSILGAEKVGFLPPMYRHPFDTKPSALGPRNERAEALMRIKADSPTVLVTQPEALLERGPDRSWIDEHSIHLSKDREYPHEQLLSRMYDAGYQRESLVDAQGQFAVRGGLIDIYPYGHENPLRIEFDVDTIESLRRFDPVTQRSTGLLHKVFFLLGQESDCTRGGLLSLLPSGMIVFWHNRDEIENRFSRFHQRLNEAQQIADVEHQEKLKLIYQVPDDVFTEAQRFRQVVWAGLTHRSSSQVDFGARQPDPTPPGLDRLSDNLHSHLNKGIRVWIAVDTSGEETRIEELLTDAGLDEVATFSPSVSGGFVSPDIGIALLTSHELFDRRRLRARHTRFRRRSVRFDRASLRKADLVVHTEYGIGMYEGMQTIKVRGHPRECLRIKYQEDVILFVRVENFGLVEKYVGSESARPKLSKLGGSEWIRTKKRTRRALQDMAGELIKLYAKRKVVRGHAFPNDTHWQQEMEASFEFDDTPDQVTTTADVKHNLEEINPMDRLLCGDVGFGKTEIAVRAAFKVVQDSFQVAILVPTTILAQQHGETFNSRLSAYPVRIEVLSRFRTPKEQREVVKGLKNGDVDIVIGTHRLLSRDIAFKKIGLLIIDEEHRFGVRHKEKLKQLKTNVDVLTLTATPIPRTLHLALMGARDTSLINTPPIDRLPVQTEVHNWSEELIKDAILREIDREGQVFFLHNRVKSIYSVKNMLERLVPGLRYGVAHGQLPERELERVITDFLRRRYDVLVTTVIIESGIDMPNVNTLIVNRADCFGLAQLYQLRGRIGRSNRQAYAYLLTPPGLIMTSEARRRLATITELTELGSGMKVAMRDLEIRGAGNLLGAQQSGYINAVGFDMYSRLLNEEVSKLKEEPPPEELSTEEEIVIDFNGPVILPAVYIDDGDLRYDFYRRLAAVSRIEEVDMLKEELTDRFGAPPTPAGNLLELARLKVLCRRANIRKLAVNDNYLIAELSLPDDSAESQRRIGELVAAADPEPVEFRVTDKVEMIYRFKSENRLHRARKFLRRLTREGILNF